jgi:pimeloyl-ACP methyl ester carboxylesterase
MPIFEHRGAALHYEEHGRGFPLLLLAPGGMRSSIATWQRMPFDPIAELAQDFHVIALDQRNAGHSVAPISAQDGWQSYTADQLALLDHLGIWRCHVLGACIGGAFALSLAAAAPQLIAAAVLEQPVGLGADNRARFYELFDTWATEIAAKHPEANAAAWSAFRERLWGGDFVFSVPRQSVQQCQTPLLVLMGNDAYHPQQISREIVQLAPRAELVEHWKEPQHVPDAVARVRSFLLAHTPSR